MKSLGNVLILGDSYSTFWGHIAGDCRPYYTPTYKDSDVHRVEDTWWHRVLAATGSTLLENSSYTGTCVCHREYHGGDNKEFSFIGRLERRIANGFFATHPVDTVIVFGTTNDSWSNAPLGEAKFSDFAPDWTAEELYTVRPACSYLLYRIRAVLPHARVLVLLNYGLKPEIGAHLKEACEVFGAELITLPDMDKMNNHPTVKGMGEIADTVLAHLNKE